MAKIKNIAVLGSGIMGSAIACHMVNAGYNVLLLDMTTPGLSTKQKKIPKLRNKLVNESLIKTIRSKPSPIYKNSDAKKIETGNFEDDLHKIADADWIIEVIIEDLEIKRTLYDLVETFRKPNSIITSNTSGIPIDLLAHERSDSFKKHFFGTHFFNPPRYLRLLEIIPGSETDPELIRDFMNFGRNFLGKESILCKDTPGFIANRIGIFSISKLMDLTSKYNLDIETVDVLTGPAIGRPKTGTYRLQDLIGIDVGEKVLRGVAEKCSDDEYLSTKKVEDTPPFVSHLLKNKFLGNKTRQGYYKKTTEKDEMGKSVILAFDLNDLDYRPKRKPRLDSVKAAKKIGNLPGKITSFFENIDVGSDFIQEYFLSLFAYISMRVPEISDNLFSVDLAMVTGYGWDVGPFEYWDMLGIEKGIKLAEKRGFSIGDWVKEMLSNKHDSFYIEENGKKKIYNPLSKEYQVIPGREKQIILSSKKDKTLFKNSEASIHDIGEGVLCLEFTSKNNVIGEGTGEAMQKAVDMAEEEGWNGIVIGNNSQNFTVGANLMLVAMLSFQKEWKKLEILVKGFQDVNMKLRYADVPVVTATQGYVFGGGVEMGMHGDSMVCAAESYIGLVEAGVGLIPGGGGTKEFALRLSDTFYNGDIMIPNLTEMFRTIAMAQVATSAPMAFDFKYLLKDRDQVVINTPDVLFQARKKVLHLADNYKAPASKKATVLGRSGMATLLTAINEFKLGAFISEHDALIANKIASVMCGGDLSAPQEVSEQYLLDLEREAFISLCGEQKTLDRIQHMLQFNKPLRN